MRHTDDTERHKRRTLSDFWSIITARSDRSDQQHIMENRESLDRSSSELPIDASTANVPATHGGNGPFSGIDSSTGLQSAAPTSETSSTVDNVLQSDVRIGRSLRFRSVLNMF